MTKSLSPLRLLSAWERAYGRSPLVKGLVLLSLAAPEDHAAPLEQVPIGVRDRALLSLRRLLFGEELTAVVACPNCDEKVELGYSVSNLCADAGPTRGELPEFDAAGSRWRLRLPCTADLLATEPLTDHAARRQTLLARCLSRSGGPTTEFASGIPDEVVDAATTRLSEADPQADLQVGADCPGCRHVWTMPFDIVSFLWSELDAWAQRLLTEIHALASAYGWSERDILELSP